MMQPAIQVQNLTKQYGSVLAVDHVNFDIAPGELVGFLGQNGAGKTTTMRVLTTFMPASSGYARVAGFDVMYQSMEVRKNLGYLPESVPLYPEMRVEEYLDYRAKLKQIDRTARRRRIDFCLDRCRIREVSRRLLGTLSKGYRQRVGLADALLSDPKVLILDEPLTGLDPVQQEETLGAIRELGGQHTVLFSSHHLPDVEKICDRVIIIDRGRIRLDDKLSNIRAMAPTLILEVRGPAADVSKFLRGQPGIKDVHEIADSHGVCSFEIKMAHDDDLRESLAKKLIEKGWGLRRIDLRRARLEELYMKTVFQRN